MIEVTAPTVKYEKVRLLFITCILTVFVISLIYYISFLNEEGYLPSPFLNDKSDTLMDYFNVLYWAGLDGAYSQWGSVYPPLNFLLMNLSKLFLMGIDYGDPHHLREGAAILIGVLAIGYLIMPAVIINTRMWDVFTITEKILIYFIIILCLPMLFTFERGNVIIVCPVLLSLALAKNNIARYSLFAILINIKPYFFILTFIYVIKRKWVALLLVLLFSFLLFVVTGLFVDPYFYLLIPNILNFGNSEELFSLRALLSFPSSVSVFSYALRNADGVRFASDFISFESIDLLVQVIENSKRLIIVFAIFSLIFKGAILSEAEILTMLVLIIGNLGLSVGGYIIIMYICLIPVFINLRYYYIYLALMCFIYLPLDIIILMENSLGEQFSFLTDRTVNVTWSLGAGAIIRPVANLLLPLVVAFEFFNRVLILRQTKVLR